MLSQQLEDTMEKKVKSSIDSAKAYKGHVNRQKDPAKSKNCQDAVINKKM